MSKYDWGAIAPAICVLVLSVLLLVAVVVEAL